MLNSYIQNQNFLHSPGQTFSAFHVSLSLSLFLCLSLSLSLSLSVPVSVVVVVVVVCACGVVWCGTLKTSVCSLAGVVPVHTGTAHAGRFERAHGKRVVVWVQRDTPIPTPTHTTHSAQHRTRKVASSVVLTENLPTYGCLLTPEVHRKIPLDLTRFQFENRSRTTCPRFLQSFALPDESVQFQQS